MNDKRLYLIDATAFCYRAFYAIGGLSTSFGQSTNAIYGFVTILNKIIKEKKPEHIIACFDVSRDTFRAKKFAEYKIQRPPMPDGLSSQIPFIKKIVSAYGISIIEKSGFEADDIIATIAQRAKAEGFSVIIVSSDKDILQLVDENIIVFNPYKNGGFIYDTQKVIERFGVSPKCIPDIIALMGDDVDNIPGVHGIGEKTATDLIKRAGSLKGLLADINAVPQEKIRKQITENRDTIKLSHELALLDKEVDIDFDFKGFKTAQPNYDELFNIFKHLEFRKLLNELPARKQEEGSIKAARFNDEALEEFITERDELFLYGESMEDLTFYSKDTFFRVENFGQNIKRVLSSPRIKKIGHDLKKIKVFMACEDTILEGLYFDTMIAAYLINPSCPGYSLADIAWEYLDKSQNPALIESVQGVGLVLQLKPKLETLLKERSLLKLFCDIEMPLAEVLAGMQLHGIKLDLKIINDLAKELEQRLITLIEKIYTLSGTQFNINSPKQLRQILFEKLKLPAGKKTKTGPSTDEEVLRNLAESHELPRVLLEYRQLSKLKSTYVDTLPGMVDHRTGRIHTSFNQTATETGRLSSSNPNLQNLPIRTDIGRKIRQAVIASDNDSYLLSCDYSQVELRILAHISKDESLINEFKDNKDIHRTTASLIFSLEEKDVIEEMRDVAKRVNFGIIYGLTAYGLSKDLHIPVDQAQMFIDAYFIRYPKVKDYIEEQIKKTERDGFVTTILGRRRYLPEINNKNQTIRQFAERQAVNTPIQGSASDLIKLAMVQIHKEINNRNFKGRMLMQVHDELVFDVPNEELNIFSAMVKDKMEHALPLSVPIKVNIKKGKNWLEVEPH